VLQRVQPVVGQLGDVFARGVDAEDAALLAGTLAELREVDLVVIDEGKRGTAVRRQQDRTSRGRSATRWYRAGPTPTGDQDWRGTSPDAPPAPTGWAMAARTRGLDDRGA